ncbi:hypothetical protein BG006_009384, partial [Podila minutissima]
YNLQQPQEFLQIYGDYVLRVLQMVKSGYCDSNHEIPPLNSFKILRGHDTAIHRSQLSKDTIGSLVDKSIAYLQELSPSKWIKSPMLSLNQSAMIKASLEILDSCNGQGNLQRHITALTCFHTQDALWKCQVHTQRQLHQEALQELQVFVQSHGGHVSMQEATLRVELCSEEDMYQFCSFLLGTNHIFNISIKMHWKPTRPSMEKLCRDVASTDLIDIARKFKRFVSEAHEASDYSTVAREFRSALEHLGLPSATVFTMAGTITESENRQIEWVYKFDLQELAFVDAYSKDMAGPRSVLLSKSLQRLTVRQEDLSLDNKGLAIVMRVNALLQELTFSYYGHDMRYYTDNIVDLWHASSVSSLTLIDHTRGTQDRVIMQLRECGRYLLQSSNTVDGQSVDSSVGQRHPQARRRFEILRMDCDHVFSKLSDGSSLILAGFLKYFPTTLTLLTLDVSRLSRDGLISMETILQRSSLEYLKVICTPVKPRMSFAVARVLRSVQWSTLKSLTLSGDNIETWISIWMCAHSNPFILYPTFGGPQLQHLHLQRTGSAPPQLLSHTSALFVHGLIYLNPSIKLVLTNFILKEEF